MGATPAQALWIRDHNAVTAQAIRGLQLCRLLPAQWDEGWQRTLAEADSGEDTNLFRKWSHYSHFFHPGKKLLMWRADSSATVSETAEELEGLFRQPPQERDLSLAASSLGRIVHHLQDMVVPAHVVPVNHFVGDGFEALQLPDIEAAPLYSPADCASLDAMTPPLALLESTARDTLATVEESVDFTVDGHALSGKWSTLFWETGTGGEFGSYGVFGNQFGVADFAGPAGERVEVESSVYTAFKRRQMRRAVLATERAILWLKSALSEGP